MLSAVLVAAGIFMSGPARANVDDVEVPDVTGSLLTVGPVADPDGGGGSYPSQRYCGKWQWNDGTQGGNHSQSQIPCIGSNKKDHMVGTGTYDYNGYSDTIQGRENDDFIEGGDAGDRLFGDYSSGDRSTDGSDIIYGGNGRDFIFGGRGTDYLHGGGDSDDLYANDNQKDYIFCADDLAQAESEYKFAQTMDAVWYDVGLDVLDESCKYAVKHSA
ncbi:MAG TPA: hypothetical protein VGO92_01700 [Acidimicrobiales bacterium]|nr:hypothetical protein [Acidimicrobiales bacterium]